MEEANQVANEVHSVVQAASINIAINREHVDAIGENVVVARDLAESGNEKLREAVEIYKKGGKLNGCILWTVIVIAVIVALLIIFRVI